MSRTHLNADELNAGGVGHERVEPDLVLIPIANLLAFVGIWIEKGMGLIVPGFIPSTLHEFVEYTPSLSEWKITAGIWALGLLVFSAAIKFVAGVGTATPVCHGASLGSVLRPRPRTAYAAGSERNAIANRSRAARLLRSHQGGAACSTRRYDPSCPAPPPKVHRPKRQPLARMT